MNPLYIIPARGGSKGIPHKNIKPLGGRPLIAYTIDVARALAPDTDHIILSTDDEKIAGTAEGLGLPVPYRRPAALATDTAGSREMMLDAMDWADARGIAYDAVVLLQPTSPFRTAGDVREALRIFYAKSPDMTVSVTEAAANPYYDIFEADSSTGTLSVSKGDGRYTRRQDAPRVWQYNGAVYVIRPDSLRRMAMGSFPVRLPLPMPRERSLDLDTPADWAVAEAMMANQSTD